MKISDNISDSHVEVMKKILEFITNFNVHKLLYAIREKSMDEETIVGITFDIREQNLKLQRQKVYLFSYCKNCNKVYALPDNKMVDTSARLSHKMRSGIRGIKDTTKSFCKRSRRKLKPGQAPPQAIDRTLLATESYIKDLFGLETYPNSVKDLFVEIVEFFNCMNECLMEAHRTLADERETRKDERQCLELLEQACQKSYQEQILFIDEMENNPAFRDVLLKSNTFMPNDDNQMLKDIANSDEKSMGSVATRYYHNCTPQDVSKITIYRAITEANGDPNLMMCMSLFNCDAAKAKQINESISIFDTLLPEKCKRNKIPAIYLHIFMKWWNMSINTATLTYFNNCYKNAGGRWETIGLSALNRPSTLKAKNDENYLKIEKRMSAKLERFYSRE